MRSGRAFPVELGRPTSTLARSGVVLERPGSIFEAETAVFSMLLRARACAQRTCCDCASDTVKLMFRAHQGCRATRRERHKIARKSLYEPFGKLFRQGRAKNSSRADSKASWRRPRTSQECPKPSQGRPGSVRGSSRACPRAVLERSGSAPRVPGSPKVAPRALRIDFSSILRPHRTVPGASQERPESHFGMIFVLLVFAPEQFVIDFWSLGRSPDHLRVTSCLDAACLAVRLWASSQPHDTTRQQT